MNEKKVLSDTNNLIYALSILCLATTQVVFTTNTPRADI